jgi:hypothetical protein
MLQDREIFFSRHGAQTALRICNFSPSFNTIQHAAPPPLPADPS